MKADGGGNKEDKRHRKGGWGKEKRRREKREREREKKHNVSDREKTK